MIIILILLLSTLSAQDFKIKGARLNYHGSHILHDWVGTSNDCLLYTSDAADE